MFLRHHRLLCTEHPSCLFTCMLFTPGPLKPPHSASSSTILITTICMNTLQCWAPDPHWASSAFQTVHPTASASFYNLKEHSINLSTVALEGVFLLSEKITLNDVFIVISAQTQTRGLAERFSLRDSFVRSPTCLEFIVHYRQRIQLCLLIFP